MPLQHSTLTADLAVGEKIDGANWDEPHEVVTSLNFPPQASDPASPVNGDLWTTTAGQLKAKLNGTVVAIAVAATTVAGYGITDAVTLTGVQTLTNKSIAATQLTGTLQAAQFPALSGDVTTSAGALGTTIAAGAVTLAKMANMATASLIYRKTAGSGAPEVQTLATLKTDLGLTGTNSGDQTITLTGDVTGSGTGSFAAAIAPAAVTLAKMANLAANSIIGNNTGSAATPAALTPTQVKTLLAIAAGDVSGLGSLATMSSVDLSGAQASGVLAAARFPALTGDVTTTAGSLATTIGNNTVGTTKIVPSSVTNAKLANMADQTLKGNISGAAAAPSDLTAAQVTAMLNAATTSLKGLVPAPGTATGLFLRDDLTWAAASGGSGITALTGDVTASGTGSVAASIAAGAVTLAKMANLSANSIIGNNTGAAATPIALTAAQVVSLIGAVDTSTTQTIGGNKTFNGTTTFSGYTQFNNWAAADGTDPTKIGAFDMSLISTGTTRTYSFPNASGTLALTSDLSAYQPLDGDLTALAALSGTNTIYYRSAASTWSAVTIGSNLTFSGGTLSSAGGVTDGDKGDVVVSGSGSTWNLDYTAVNATIAPVFANITSKPTTVSGYGITDAVTTSGNQTVAGTKTLSDPLILTGQTSDPSSPADGTVWHDSQIDTIKAVFGTRTRDLLADLVNSGAMIWKALANGTSFSNIGINAPSAVGTATAAAIAVTNKHTMTPRVEALVTVASTTAVAGFRDATAGRVTVGGASADLGGFRFTMIWGPATGVATTTNRGFAGLHSTATPTDVEPSSLTNGVWMGWDAADTNIQLMRNDGSGTATKIDLGSNFPVPTTDRTSVYKLDLYSPKGTTQSVQYRVTDIVNGYVAQGTISSDLPGTSQLLTPKVWMSVGGTSSVIGVALMSVYLDPLL